MNKTMMNIVTKSLVVFILLSFTGCSSEFNERDAWVCAKMAVEDRLKSPSTAKFCSYPDATVRLSGTTYTVSGYVDAQNGFGATVRSNFTVVLTSSRITSVTIY